MTRRAALLGAGGLLLSGAAAASPEALGFAPGLAAAVDEALRTGALRGLHGLVLTRHGIPVLERYVRGRDEAWGHDLGEVDFGPETLHDLRSVTKSIVGLLYGIALAEGAVPPPEASLLEAFPEYPDLRADPARLGWQVAHALTMTLGTAWNEDLPYTDPANSEIAMERAADRYRFILDRPLVAAPGTRWIYNGGATALLGRLIARGTGRTLPDYARARLFAPLGIEAFAWATGADGVASAASGLRLRPRDLARIGEMVLRGGRTAEGVMVVPEAWLDAAFRPAVTIEEGFSYGRHWYRGGARLAGPAGAPPRWEPWVAAMGNGGQRLWLLPSLGVVLVVTAGLYNRPDQQLLPQRILRDLVLARLGTG